MLTFSTSLHNCCTRLFCVEDDDDGHAWSAMLKTCVRHVLHVMDHILLALIAQQVLYSRRSIIFALKYYI